MISSGWKRKPLSKVFSENNKEVFARRSKAKFLRQVEGVRIGSLRPYRRKEFQQQQQPQLQQQDLVKEVKKQLEEEQVGCKPMSLS